MGYTHKDHCLCRTNRSLECHLEVGYSGRVGEGVYIHGKRLVVMHLNAAGQVWVHCCQEWRQPLRELWTPREDDKLSDIWCLEHPEVHLGYESDLVEAGKL